MIMFQRRFSNVFVDETEISPTLEAGGGEGGNNLPMICVKPNEPIVFTTEMTPKVDGGHSVLPTQPRL